LRGVSESSRTRGACWTLIGCLWGCSLPADTLCLQCADDRNQNRERNGEFPIDGTRLNISTLRLQFRKLLPGILGFAGTGIQPERLLQLLAGQSCLSALRIGHSEMIVESRIISGMAILGQL
jgi:hypothetical protein